MASQGSSQELRLKLRIHARAENSRLNPEGEEIGSPPELLVPHDLDLADGTIVVISQARENANHPDSSEHICRNELVLKATVNWKLKSFRRQQVSLRGDLAERFGFRNMKEVFLSQLTADARPLTLVEFGFRDDYISRSDYWHFSDTLVNSCLCVDQVMEQNGIKARVLQLYDDTKKVNSGMISTNTRVVFRSSSAQIFLFVQLSAEMWEFDELGDIYFERALKRFIRPLCSNWQQNQCHHELTVVYFSRTFYLSDSWEQFPEDTVRKNSVQRLDNGAFYQDFYKVIIQDEIRSDWSSIIQTLKREFFQYKRNIGLTDPSPGMPQCYNSQARYGNFLEAINLTLNIFEQHYHDRILDRTGQQFAMITPSQGVFENSLELIEITERRMLDYGIGTDIIFLTRQPLHAVPLFIYQDKSQEISPHPKYHVAAHWLNFSYLGEDLTMDIRRDNPKSFQPVLKLPDDIISPFRGSSGESDMKKRGCRNPLGKVPNEFWVDVKPKDVDMLTYMRLYDAQIWKDASGLPQLWETFSQTPLKISPSTSPNTVNTPLAHHLNTPTILESNSFVSRFTDSSVSSLPFPQLSQTISLPGFLGRPSSGIGNSLSSSYPHDLLAFPGGSSLGSSIPEFHPINIPRRPASSQGNIVTHSHEINPFNRNCHLTQTSSSRRRWAHCFPASNRGIIVRDNYLREPEVRQDTVQVYHGCDESVFAFSDFQEGFKSKCTDDSPLAEDQLFPLFDDIKSAGLTKPHALPYNQSAPTCVISSRLGDSLFPHKKLHRSFSAPDSVPTLKVVGEVVEAFVKRGINWKSLIHPALCPITNDFFPGDSILNSEQYYLSTNVIIETLVSVGSQTCEEQVLSAIRELISQRLVCGFQLITTVHGNVFSINELLNINTSSMPFSSSGTKLWLSLGEVYHELIVMINSSYNQLVYTANVYKPANLKRHTPITYVYNLWPIGRSSFELAELRFQQSDLWTERWTQFDHSIWKKEYHQMMQQQDTFWSVQFILLPESLPTDPLFPLNANKAAEWRKEKFRNFTTFLDQINAAKQKMSQRGSDPVNRRGSKLRSEDPDNEATKEKLLRCIRQQNWHQLVQTVQDTSSNFTGYFHISGPGPCARTDYFILSKLMDYLTGQLTGLLTGEEVWRVVLTLGKKGFISRFDDPTFSIESNGYYICSFQGGELPSERGHSRLPHAPSAEQICAIEVLWDQKGFFMTRSNAHLAPHNLPPIHPDFNEGQRICPLLDSLLPPTSCPDGSAGACTSVVHLSHDKAYSPFAGFRIELQFRVASTSLLNQAVSEFKHFAHKSGYVLKLYPSCHTLSDLFSHPFRRPYHIPLLLPGDAQLDTSRVVQIMNLIAFKFGFIKESHLSFVPSPPYTPSQLGKDRFTHFTGQYFVSLVPQGLDHVELDLVNNPSSPDKGGCYSKPGFLWWNNFLLNRRSRSRVACKEHNTDLSSMIAFCAGNNGLLEEFLLESRNVHVPP